MATIGLRDLFVAPITIEDGKEVYGATRRLAKAISVDMSVEVASESLYADDGVDEIIREFVKGSLKLKANDIAPKDYAELLGQYIDDDGVIFAGENDDPPYYAVGFRAKKTKGQYRYVWLYKTKFKVPNEKYDTKANGISISTPELEGEFIKRDSDGMWKSDFTGLPEDPIAQAWFEEVKEYTAPVSGA